MRIAFLLLALGTLAACQSRLGTSSDPLFRKLAPEETHLEFTNTVTDDKEFNVFNYRNFYNGGGVAIGDVNGDGQTDVFMIANMGENKLFLNRRKPDTKGFTFEDVTAKAGVGGKKAWSTGATFADINGDGRLDLYVCNAGIRPGDDRANELYINQGNDANGVPTFKEQAAALGLDDHGFSTHAAFFDYDRDGDLDMYLLNNSFTPVGRLQYANIRAERDSLGGQKLFRNMSVERSGSRRDGRGAFGAGMAGGTKDATFASPATPAPKASLPSLPLFEDVSAKEGIYGSLIGFGLGITIGDVNDDNWPDIYISNDFYERDYLYINTHDAQGRHTGFRESVKEAMPHISLSSMGADVADINNDGKLDIFVTDMLPGKDDRLKRVSTFEGYDLEQIKLGRDFHYQIMQNMLHLNRGNQPGNGGLPTFSDVARFAGVHATDWSWGALIFDMDNDGQKDIFVANGIARDVTDQDFVNFLADRENMAQVAQQQNFDFKKFLEKAPSEPIPNYAFRNEGDLRFVNKAADWGLDEPSFSNGSAYGDLDNDGDLDLIVNNVNQPASVYENRANEQLKANYLSVKLNGQGQNRNAIGARVYVHQHDAATVPRMQVLQQMPNRGFQSSVDLTMVFGLGTLATIDSVVVVWPDDRKQTLRQPKANQVLTLKQQEATERWKPTVETYQPFLTEQPGTLAYTHRESNFVDYNRDALLKQRFSTQGPAMATGDVTGDGLDDVYFGGASGQGGRLFVQQAGGRFQDKTPAAMQQDTTTEATDAVLFDADGDGDLDLYVVTGSNEFGKEVPELADLLYLNDGKGGFTRSPENALPNLQASGACVAVGDYDHDGDLDLFVGARMVPGEYGRNPASYLLTNDGRGQFKNYTKRALADADQLGMVTSATWADLNNDQYPELVVVGDWEPIRVFENQRGRLVQNPDLAPKTATGDVPKTNGWWNTVTAGDADGDGDLDLLLGNLGLNSRLKASPNVPAELYVDDYDNNGNVDQIITCADETGQLYPMVLKADLQKQMPTIKKRFVKFTEFAGKKIDEVLTEDQLKQSLRKEVFMAESVLLLNDGRGHLTLQPLPAEAQLSPIAGAVFADVNADGRADLLLTGNFFDVLPEIGRYDAHYGLVLLNRGKTEAGQVRYEALNPAQSGLFVPGQVRKVARLRQGQFIFAKNNAPAQVFSLTKK
jgi:enediyne biosynthesis protein E4